MLVDIAVHFVKANGKPARKVFKLKRLSLPPRAEVELQTTVSLAVHTTRKPSPGVHAVDVQVNGETFPGRVVCRHRGSPDPKSLTVNAPLQNDGVFIYSTIWLNINLSAST